MSKKSRLFDSLAINLALFLRAQVIQSKKTYSYHVKKHNVHFSVCIIHCQQLNLVASYRYKEGFSKEGSTNPLAFYRAPIGLNGRN